MLGGSSLDVPWRLSQAEATADQPQPTAGAQPGNKARNRFRLSEQILHPLGSCNSRCCAAAFQSEGAGADIFPRIDSVGRAQEIPSVQVQHMLAL